jgi:hypothetical protein
MELLGKDWEKSVMRLKKTEIMRLYRDMCIEKLKLEKRIKEDK